MIAADRPLGEHSCRASPPADVHTTSPARRPSHTLLEELIHRQKKTYKEAAAVFMQLARTMGSDATITPRHLRRLAAGERSSTSKSTARVLETMFDHSVQALLAAHPISAHPPAPASPAFPPISPTTHPPTSEEIVLMAAQQAQTFTLFSPSPLPETALEQIHSEVQRLSQAYPQTPVSQLVAELAHTQNAVFSLLEQHHRPADASQLYLLAGVVSGMLAKASHDMGNSQAASTQARAAYTAAEMAQHNGLRAWIRGLQSLVAYWAGRYTDAVKYAQEGQRFVDSGTAGAWVSVSEARAWAAMGDVEHAQLCIKTAEQNWQSMTPDELDELGGMCTFTHSRHLYYIADALAWLPTQAGEAAQRSHIAVQAYQDRNAVDWSFGDEAGSRTDLAMAQVHLGNLEAAQQALRPVWELPTAMRINGIVRSVGRVQQALSIAFPRQDPAVNQLREQIDNFTRSGVASGSA